MSWRDKEKELIEKELKPAPSSTGTPSHHPGEAPAAGGTYGLTAEPSKPATIDQPHTLQGAAGVGPHGAPATPGAYPGSQGYVEGPSTHTPVLDAPAYPPTEPTPDLRPAPPIWFQAWRAHTHVPLADQEVADLVKYIGELEVADRTLLNRLSAGLGSGLVGSI